METKLAELNPEYPDLNIRIAYYLQAMATEDYDGILLLTYPGLFDLVPKNVMREKIKDMFHQEDMDFSMDHFSISNIGKVLVHVDGRYVKVDYQVLMALRFRDHASQDAESKAEKQDFFLSAFKAAYGKDNIWFEETTESYCFYKQNSMVAIIDYRSAKWTFLTLQPGPMMERFLPDSIRVTLEASMDANEY